MATNLTSLQNLLSRQDTYVDFMVGMISQTRALAIKLERCEDEITHRRKTGRHLSDLRPTDQILKDIDICRAQIELNMVQYVSTVEEIVTKLEGFNPQTVLRLPVEVNIAAEVA